MKRQQLYILLIFIIAGCNPSPQVDNASSLSNEQGHIDTAKAQAKAKVANKTERGTRPIDDQTHIEAAVMAKEFVIKKLNLSPPPSFDDAPLDWIKLKHNIYKISSVVSIVDSNCLKHKYNWVVTLKYKNGDWTDIKNWKLLGIKIIQ